MNRITTLVVALWTILLSGIAAWPWINSSADPGDDLIRGTIRLSLAYYAAAIGLMLFLRPAEWRGSGRGQLARMCWSLAWAAFIVHVGMAFHFFHHWSHADAVQHTEDVSGFGPGIYISHLFTLAWTVDVAWWWFQPTSYAVRSAWIGRSLHAFMIFMVFNGTVVYETGPIRWMALTMFVALIGLCTLARTRRVAAGVS